MKNRLRILTFVDFYEPGYLAGGPITTLRNMVRNLGDEVEFCIVTRNHDLGANQSYTDIDSDRWLDVNGTKVIYLSPESIRLTKIMRTLSKIYFSQKPDTIYLNSVMSKKFSIFPFMAFRKNVPFIIAPRGEFAEAALCIKPVRKKIFLSIMKSLNLWQSVVWQASSEFERQDIQKVLGNGTHVRVAPDMPSKVLPLREREPKIADQAKLAFVGRISQMKNIHSLFPFLKRVKFSVEFNLYGPIEDEQYWQLCRAEIAKLPENILVQHKGSLRPSEVRSVLVNSDALFLPSLGENFGHVVLEALAAGCPAYVSDRTPWKMLAENGCGMCIPLKDANKWIDAFNSIAKMNENEHRKMRTAAHFFATRFAKDGLIYRQNLNLFFEN